MELFLIRHGRTEDNARGRYTGRRETMLDTVGEEQAEAVAWALEPRDIRTVICSPLMRARQTAQRLCFIWGVLEPEFDADWTEMDFGLAAGLTYEELKAKAPEVVKGWADDWMGFTLPDGENGAALYGRVRRALDRLMREHAREPVAVVTHLGCIRFALSHLLHGGPERFWDHALGHGGYAHIRADEDGNKLVGLTDSLVLPAD